MRSSKDLGISALEDDLGLLTDVEAPGDETTSAVAKCSVCGGAMRLFETAGIWVCNASPAVRAFDL